MYVFGNFASINQRLDAETIQIVADEFGFETEFVSAEVQESITIVEDLPEELLTRPLLLRLWVTSITVKLPF